MDHNALVLLMLTTLTFSQTSEAFCEYNGTSSRAYNVYELAAIGSEVYYGDFNGTVPDISLNLESPLDEYFKFNGEQLLVNNNITRDKLDISGRITCTSAGTGVPLRFTFVVVKINTANPVEFEKNPYDESLDESAPIGTEIETVAKDDDVDDLAFEVTRQDPFEYFELKQPQRGVLRLMKSLDFETDPNITIELKATSTGVDNAGNTFMQSSTTTVRVRVHDIDEFAPEFDSCVQVENICVPPFYTATVESNREVDYELTIEPKPISASDPDMGIANSVTYTMRDRVGKESEYFKIDANTGIVSVRKQLNRSISTEDLTVFATELTGISDGRSSYAFLTVSVNGDLKIPETTLTCNEACTGSGTRPCAGNVSEADGVKPVLDCEGNPFIITTADDDDPTAEFVYEVNDKRFQVFDDQLYFFPSPTMIYATTITVEINAINLNADLLSPNRKSEPVKVEVTVESSPTAQSTTEAISEPTTPGTTFESTTATAQSTTEAISEPTTPGATFESTTASSTTECPEVTPGNQDILYIVAGVLSFIIVVLLILVLWLLCHGTKKNSGDRRSAPGPNTGLGYSNDGIQLDETHNGSTSTPTGDTELNQTTEIEVVANGTAVTPPPTSEVSDEGAPPTSEVSDEGEQDTEIEAPYEVVEEPGVAFATAAVAIDDDRISGTTTSNDDDVSSPRDSIADDRVSTGARISPTALVAAQVALNRSESPPAAAPVTQEDAGFILDYSTAFKRNAVRTERVLKSSEFRKTSLITLLRFGYEQRDRQGVEKVTKTGDAEFCDQNMHFLLMTKAVGGRDEHEHVLKFYGAHEEGEELRHAIEYACNGNLRDFLAHKKYLSAPLAVPFDSTALMRLIEGIGKGLGYLHRKSIIHCNLRASNIWLDANLTPKIHAYEDNQMTANNRQACEERYRWQAIEVINGHNSSKSSDVWSFGVVMWEIAMFGDTPYFNMTFDDVKTYLRDGKRLQKPNKCSDSLFSLIETCWAEEPRQRPDVPLLHANIAEKLLEDAQTLIGMNPDGARVDDVTVDIDEDDDMTSF